MSLAGRVVGVATALAVIALWATFLVRNPYAPTQTDLTFLLACTMMLGGAIAAAAAARGAYVGMYLLFFVMFFPVGLYVWMSPGIFSAIGWLQIAYAVGAVLVHVGVVQARRRAG